MRLPITTNVSERAAALAWQNRLRAYDALHLACALVWQEIMQEDVVIACFDNNLLEAARQAGLKTWPEP